MNKHTHDVLLTIFENALQYEIHLIEHDQDYTQNFWDILTVLENWENDHTMRGSDK